ncbi:OB-fold protein [Ascidiimonas sp. W6]|uniref:OB-fold protein n=1 Tax=Ascidiimonas meishanensis TaxID=3128903 RepID=UPI0030EC6F35
MMKKKIIISVLFLITITVGGLGYNYVFNAKHRDIANEKTAVNLSAETFYIHFKENETLATTNYLDKVIELKGKITSVEDTDIVLNYRIQVGFSAPENIKLQKGETLTIKGRCVGYDELLEMVKIDQATILK